MNVVTGVAVPCLHLLLVLGLLVGVPDVGLVANLALVGEDEPNLLTLLHRELFGLVGDVHHLDLDDPDAGAVGRAAPVVTAAGGEHDRQSGDDHE